MKLFILLATTLINKFVNFAAVNNLKLLYKQNKNH